MLPLFHPPVVSLRRSGRLLDPHGGTVPCRRRPAPVDREPVPRRVGVRRPAREFAQRQPGVDPLGDRPSLALRRVFATCPATRPQSSSSSRRGRSFPSMAVAEERSQIARELHDVVAHASARWCSRSAPSGTSCLASSPRIAMRSRTSSGRGERRSPRCAASSGDARRARRGLVCAAARPRRSRLAPRGGYARGPAR
jgi:hypothetical protein